MKSGLRFKTKWLFVLTTGIGSIAFVCQYAPGDSLSELAKNLLLFYVNCFVVLACLLYGASYRVNGVYLRAMTAITVIGFILQLIVLIEPQFWRFLSLHVVLAALLVWQLSASCMRVLAQTEADVRLEKPVNSCSILLSRRLGQANWQDDSALDPQRRSL